MIARQSDFRKVHKLYVNQTWDRQTPATVQVEESGTYQVTIFPIKEGTILDTNIMEYIEHVVVSVMNSSTTTQGIPL